MCMLAGSPQSMVREASAACAGPQTIAYTGTLKGSFKLDLVLAQYIPSSSMASMPTQGASRAVICAVRHTALSRRCTPSALQTSSIRLRSPISTVRCLAKQQLSVQRRCITAAASESNGSSPSTSGLTIDLRGEASTPSHVQICQLRGLSKGA